MHKIIIQKSDRSKDALQQWIIVCNVHVYISTICHVSALDDTCTSYTTTIINYFCYKCMINVRVYV